MFSRYNHKKNFCSSGVTRLSSHVHQITATSHKNRFPELCSGAIGDYHQLHYGLITWLKVHAAVDPVRDMLIAIILSQQSVLLSWGSVQGRRATSLLKPRGKLPMLRCDVAILWAIRRSSNSPSIFVFPAFCKTGFKLAPQFLLAFVTMLSFGRIFVIHF